MSAIKTAISMLDPANDEHWTAQGYPRVDAVSEIVGAEVTRGDITNAWPSFSRSQASEPVTPPALNEPILSGAEPEAETEAPSASPEPPASAPVSMLESEGISEDSVLALPFNEVMHDYGKLMAASNALAELSKKIEAEKAAVTARAKAVNEKAEVVSILLARMDKPKKSSGIQDFLKAQAKTREAKAARAKAFLAQGVTAKEVIAELNSKSKLDQSMSQRKPAPGSTRPALRIPVRR